MFTQSWAQCQVMNWNLSANCITSSAAQAALDVYLSACPTLHNEIKQCMGVVYGVKEMMSAESADDDTDVQSSAVIQDALGLNNSEIPTDGVNVVSHCVETAEKGSGNSLVATEEFDSIWRYVSFN